MDFMHGILLTGWVLTFITLIGVNRYSHKLEWKNSVLEHENRRMSLALHTRQAKVRNRRRADETVAVVERAKVENPHAGYGVPREREASTARARPVERRWAGGKGGDTPGSRYVSGKSAVGPTFGDAPRLGADEVQPGRVRPGQAAELPPTEAGPGSHEESDYGQQQGGNGDQVP